MPLTTCPVGLDAARLRAEVQSIYARVSAEPGGAFHFHRGPGYAAEFLGYDPALLDCLPEDVTGSFAGVANPHLVARIPRGATVLDMGSGAGTDLLIAAIHAGPSGRAIGIDMTEAMAARARSGAASVGLPNVEVRVGDATAMPVETATIDVLISNGVFNLIPEKDMALAEMFRVLKPGGRLQLGDIVLGGMLDDDARGDIDLWAG